ncbi:flagellin [Methylobacter svalbardensis]|uniref:flagellin N-terminal helical domain-containing protein n=1 Tax=Methylobacter svalbardensis TaxID=3080016 RepID=UPI0030EE5A63
MSLNVNTNLSSMSAQRFLSNNQGSLTSAMQRLSSGLRINSAKDDAAGLAISERFTSQIRGNDQAARNANDGISLAQTAEGDLGQITTNLQRIRELAVQSANASNSASDRATIQAESKSLVDEIDRVAANSSFNGIKLLDGNFTSQAFQVGANNTANDSITINSIASSRTVDLGESFLASKTSAATLSALGAGDLTLQVGTSTFSVGAAVNGTNGNTSNSAKQIAAAINAVSSGVTATANSNVVTGAVVATVVGVGGTVDINGATINFASGSMTGTAATDGAYMAGQITASSAVTGVTAAYDSATNKITMTATDGRNIDVNTYTGAGFDATDTGFAVATGAAANRTTFSLSSSNSFTIAGTTPTNAGLTATTVTAAATGTSVSNIDLSSVAGAKTALDSIDSALKSVNNSRADLGAYQNRFQSTITSLQTTTENLTASRSRILDADFAKESANLSRAQVLQQAGTAMLAQANQSAQGVLSLLR